MRSIEFSPCPALRPYVRLIWLFEADGAHGFDVPERVAPDGLVEVVFHFRTPVSCRYDGEQFQPQARSVAISQTRRFLEFRPETSTGFISVRFQPWGGSQFFRLPVSEFSDRQVPCEALWGPNSLELEERLAEANSDPDRVKLIERFLLGQLLRHEKTSVELMVKAIWRQKGQIVVPRLCRELGIGERTLQRLSANALGASPKHFARLSRFLHACSQLRRYTGKTLTQVGLGCGYYDQSHFISEFKEYSGHTPRQFIEAQNLSFLETD